MTECNSASPAETQKWPKLTVNALWNSVFQSWKCKPGSSKTGYVRNLLNRYKKPSNEDLRP